MLGLGPLFTKTINNWKKQVHEHKCQILRLHSRQLHFLIFFPKPSFRAGRQYIFLCTFVPPGLLEAAQTFFVSRPPHGQHLEKLLCNFREISTSNSKLMGQNLQKHLTNALNILSNAGWIEQLESDVCNWCCWVLLCCSGLLRCGQVRGVAMRWVSVWLTEGEFHWPESKFENRYL